MEDMTLEEMRDRLDQILMNRFEAIMEHARTEDRLGFDEEKIKDLMSKEKRELRLELLVRGASPSEEAAMSMAELNERFMERLREDGVRSDRPLEGTGEDCHLADMMERVIAIRCDEERSYGLDFWEERVVAAISSQYVRDTDSDLETEWNDRWRRVCVATRSSWRASTKSKVKAPTPSIGHVTVPHPDASHKTAMVESTSDEVVVKAEPVLEVESTEKKSDGQMAVSADNTSLRELEELLEVNPIETFIVEQKKESFARNMTDYLLNKRLPTEDPYMKSRILKMEEDYAVSDNGVLCRLWYRDPRQKNVLDPVRQIYVPESLRGAVVRSMHGGRRSGHLSPMKTWQRIRETWYWPGMFADVHSIVRECGVCATRGRRPPKQQIQGHVRSDIPGEVWVMDVLHFPESKWGNKYALTMVDVASRWAYIVPMKEISSASVMKVVEDRIIGDGINPRLFITDNGSEFKKDFLAFCELYRIKVRKSVPHHAEGHGLVEAFNRTIADVIGHMIEEDGGDWEENLPWARRVYLSSIHSALQSKSVGLSPAEAFRGAES